ncbi:MAG: glycoside hydrolase family 15 protein [Bacteroidales bacterium]
MLLDTPAVHPAFGHPGMAPRWTSSSKDGVGTAYSSASHVWFTVSYGILNEIYYPTIDRPQVRDMQFLITDGDRLFHEERRDLVSQIDGLDEDILGYHVVNTDPEGRYRVVKDIIADPHQPCVLIRAVLDGEWADRLGVYALLAPHLEVGGWGNSARVLSIGGKTVLLAWKDHTWLAMGADRGFVRASCGYVGASDGWQDLHDNRRLDWEFDEALDGNIALVGELGNAATPFTLGVAFGFSAHSAITRLAQSLAVPFDDHCARFVDQWRRARHGATALGSASKDGGRLYRISRNLLLAHEDKSFAGAMIASASIPWGNAKGDEDLGGYHLVWTRDMVQSVGALVAAGDTATALRALVYLACSQHADGGFGQNFWIDGTPYWSAVQVDEVAFPLMLAWRLWKLDALRHFDPYPMVIAAARFLVTHGPATEQERWEECGGYSPSTLAAMIAALVCAADFAAARGRHDAAAFLLDHADFLESHVERWTVTTDGTLVPGVPRHYIRIAPAVIGDPSPDEDPDNGVLVLANQPPGGRYAYPAKEIVDAGFLELVRYGIRPPGDPLIEDSLHVVDAVLKVDTPFGPCWRRYNHDGYGTRNDGGPYEGWGQGRAWPLLTGERAHYELAVGRPVAHLVAAIEGFASKGGMLPEQVWDEAASPSAALSLGRPAGSAMPLMWAHAEYVKLLRSMTDGAVFDAIAIVADRYRSRRGRADLEIWKPTRQVRQVAPGHVLRVQAEEPFVLHSTADGWQTVDHRSATATDLGVYFADVRVPREARAPIQFTFFWTARQSWEGRNYEVHVRA